MKFATPILDYVDALVHAHARCDALTAARHRASIAAKLIFGISALAAFPAYAAVRGVPGPLEILMFAWLATSILVAWYLSRTGKLERTQILSTLLLTGLGTAIAAATGGIASFATIWLVIVPLEAALSASSRVVVFAATLAAGAVALLLVLQLHDLLPAASAPDQAFAIFGIGAAAFYVAGLAVATQSLAHAAARMLRSEQDHARRLADSMTDVITRHDARGAVFYASPAAETALGIPAYGLLGQGLHDRVHEADRPAYVIALADAAVLGRARTLELRLKRDVAAPPRVGDDKWIEMRCRPDRLRISAAGAECDVIAVLRDIGERKAQQHALEAAQAELSRIDGAHRKRLATLGHELRTPLNAVIGFSQILANQQHVARDDPRWPSYARLINEAGLHLLSVVDTMFDPPDTREGEFRIAPAPFRPAPVIHSCCDLLSVEARRAGLDLALRLEGELPEINADRRAFRQILLNLISNAVRYTDPGGKIAVRAEVEDRALKVTVEDTGIGVASEDIPRIVDPFVQTKAARERDSAGAGLGLSIVSDLVARHGGALSIASRVGEGTRVTVSLPLAAKTAGGTDSERKIETRQPAAPSAGAAEIRVKTSASA